MTKYLFLTIFFISSLSVVSQNDIAFFQNIEKTGSRFVSNIKNGDIERLKNVVPPKETWTYEKLEIYKKQLTLEHSNIQFGSYIEASQKKDNYGYNFFAYKQIENSFEYFFVAIINVNTSNNMFKVDNSYLFTEKKALKDWWSHTFGFYKSKSFKDIPEQFKMPACPPPPFRH